MIRLDIQRFGGRGAYGLFSSGTEKRLLTIEQGKIGLKRELMTIMSRDGKILKQVYGKEHSVNVSKYADLQKNAITSHNHPNNGIFSESDVRNFIDYDRYEIRVSTKKAVYSIKRSSDGVSDKFVKRYAKAKNKAHKKAIKDINEKIRNRTLGYTYFDKQRLNADITKMTADNTHDWLLKNAKKNGIIYRKIRYK